MLHAGLIDTGAIVAILESDDEWHTECLRALTSLQLPLLTSEAVLTEAFHLMGSNRYQVDRVWKFVRSGAVKLCEMGDSDLTQIHALMSQYHDRPMDFADATLVHIGNRESVSLILTIDHDDFETYRLAGNKKFTIRPMRTKSR